MPRQVGRRFPQDAVAPLETGNHLNQSGHKAPPTQCTGLAQRASPYFRVATARFRAGNSVRQISHTVPSQPRAVQCSRP
jgi:hypothetical protein